MPQTLVLGPILSSTPAPTRSCITVLSSPTDSPQQKKHYDVGTHDLLALFLALKNEAWLDGAIRTCLES